MKLTFLGTGTPTPTAEREGSANLVEIDDLRLLVDAGRGATSQLARAGVGPESIDRIFITHHHFDHMSSLDDVLLSAWNGGRNEPIEVYGPQGTAAIVDALLHHVYARDIEFRLLEASRIGTPMADLRDLVVATDVGSKESVELPGARVEADLVEHGHALGLTHHQWPCLGYRIEAEGKSLVFSGDAIACEALDRLAAKADLLVHCCYLAEAEITTTERRFLVEHVLAGSVQAGGTAARAHVAKLALTHLAPMGPAGLGAIRDEVQRSYRGEVVIAEDLMSIHI